MRSRTGGTLATIYQGFCRRLQGPGTALGLEIPGKRRRNYGCTDLYQSTETFLASAPTNVGCGRAAAQATAKPGCRGVGQTFRGSPAVGPDELAHLRPPRGARARSALGPHLLPDSPTSPWLTSPTPRSGADNRLARHGWPYPRPGTPGRELARAVTQVVGVTGHPAPPGGAEPSRSQRSPSRDSPRT